MSGEVKAGSGPLSRKPPTEVKLVAFIEAFAGISYILYTLRYLGTIDIWLAIPIIMALLSFWIAYGLWRIKRTAWFLSFAFSAFGAIIGTVVLLLMPLNTESLMLNAPKPILDMLTIALLMSKDVRTEFGFLKSEAAKP